MQSRANLQDLLVENIESIQNEIDKSDDWQDITADLFVLQLEAIDRIVDLELIFGDSSDCAIHRSYVVDATEVEDVL